MTFKDDFEYLRAIYNDFGKITDSIFNFAKINYPDNIKELIKENFKLFENFINFYSDDAIFKINQPLCGDKVFFENRVKKIAWLTQQFFQLNYIAAKCGDKAFLKKKAGKKKLLG